MQFNNKLLLLRDSWLPVIDCLKKIKKKLEKYVSYRLESCL